MYHGPAWANGQNGLTYVIAERDIGIDNVKEAILWHIQVMEMVLLLHNEFHNTEEKEIANLNISTDYISIQNKQKLEPNHTAIVSDLNNFLN